MLAKIVNSSGGRKFVLAMVVCLGILATATVLMYLSRIDGDQWVAALAPVKWIALAFLGANVMQKLKMPGGAP